MVEIRSDVVTSPSRSRAWILAVFFVLAFGSFGDAFVSYRTLLPTGHLEHHEPWQSELPALPPGPDQQHDLIFQFYPWAHFLKESAGEGRFPLWNPYNYLGTPFFANPQTAVLFPGSWLHLVLPLRYSFTALLILKLFLVLSGTFLWLRQRQLSLPAAVFGAFAFGLSMHTVAGLAFPYGSVTSLLPWLLFATERLAVASRPGEKRRAFAGASTAAALVVLAGQPQSALVAFLAAVLWTLLGARPPRLGTSIRVGSALLTGGLLSGIQWIPSLAYTMESMVPEAPRFIQSGYPYSWGSFLTLVVPDFFGSLLDDTFWGFPGYHDLTFYSSALLLILIPIGLSRGTLDTAHRPALVGGLLAFALMIGLAPFEWLLDLPGFDLVRRNKLVPLLLLSLIYLAAAGLDLSLIHI